jgi:hypothetical protein
VFLSKLAKNQHVASGYFRQKKFGLAICYTFKNKILKTFIENECKKSASSLLVVLKNKKYVSSHPAGCFVFIGIGLG